jgi:hypothetical protein
MKIYEFVGSRGDWKGQTLLSGDRITVTPEEAEYLTVQGFPVKEIETEETKDEVIENVSI